MVLVLGAGGGGAVHRLLQDTLPPRTTGNLGYIYIYNGGGADFFISFYSKKIHLPLINTVCKSLYFLSLGGGLICISFFQGNISPSSYPQAKIYIFNVKGWLPYKRCELKKKDLTCKQFIFKLSYISD